MWFRIRDMHKRRPNFRPGTYPVCFLLALALALGATSSALAQNFMTTGSYTGDGSSYHTITDVGFQPDLVIVKDIAANFAMIRTASMPAGASKTLADDTPLSYDQILSLDPNGFTLGSGEETNNSGHTYHWVAMRADTGSMILGQYVGDGYGSRNIDINMDPQAVLIIPANGESPVFHTQDMSYDESYPFDGSGEISEAIHYIIPNTFQIGDSDNVNHDGDTYYYVAWHSGDGIIDNGSYDGASFSEQDDRNLINADTDHQYVIIQADTFEPTVQRMASLSGDTSLLFLKQAAEPNLIQDMWPIGIQVGSDPAVNTFPNTYYILSFGNSTAQADLWLQTSVDNNMPHEGDEIHVAVGITNLGTIGTSGVVVDELLPAGLTLTTVSIDRGSYDAMAGEWDVGSLANGDTASLILGATVDAGTAGTIITNTAWVTASDKPDPDTNDNIDSVDIFVLGAPQADLAVLKTVDDGLPNEGETITYTVTVTNNGPDDATGIVVNDALPAGLSLSVATPDQGTYDDGTGNWAVGSLAGGDSATLTLLAAVDAGTAGNTIINTAALTAAGQNDPEDGNDADSASLTVAGTPLADLAVTLTLDDDAPQEGDTVTYDLTVINNGPDAASGVQISDLLPSGLTFSQATPSKGTYDSGTGLWTIGDLMDGGGALLVLKATVDGGTIGDVITNTAAVSAVDQADPAEDNDSAARTLTVTGSDLVLAMTLDDDAPREGQDILYVLTVTNDGPNPATGIQVTDLLPTGLTLKNANPDQGTYDAGTGVWDIGDLADGDVAQLPLVATTDLGTADMDIVNTGTISAADQIDPDTADNMASVSLTVTGAPLTDLGLDLTLDNAAPGEGAQVNFQLTVTNNGPNPATSVQVMDLIPSGLTFSDATATSGAYDDGTGVWDIGDLAVGASVGLTLSVTTDLGTAG